MCAWTRRVDARAGARGMVNRGVRGHAYGRVRARPHRQVLEAGAEVVLAFEVGAEVVLVLELWGRSSVGARQCWRCGSLRGARALAAMTKMCRCRAASASARRPRGLFAEFRWAKKKRHQNRLRPSRALSGTLQIGAGPRRPPSASSERDWAKGKKKRGESVAVAPGGGRRGRARRRELRSI